MTDAPPCWAHKAGCPYDGDCPALNSVYGHPCDKPGTGRLGLCEEHEDSILVMPT